MKKLILDPKNVLLSKKNKNFFLNQFFINFIDLNKKKKLDFLF